jgi:hypothetical protein
MSRSVVPSRGLSAACRDLVIGLLRRSGATSHAAALRIYAARPAAAILFLLSAGRL